MRVKSAKPPVFLIAMLFVFGGLWLALARRQQTAQEDPLQGRVVHDGEGR